MDGQFGSNVDRVVKEYPEYNSRKRNAFLQRLKMLSPERWVDIVCCSLFVTIVFAVVVNWTGFMDGLFFNVLLPVISVGGKLLVVVGIIAIVVFLIKLRFHRRRFW